MKIRRSLRNLLLICIILITMGLPLLQENPTNEITIAEMEKAKFESHQSTNSSNPDLLTLDISEFEYYANKSKYYYRTENPVDTTYSQVIWLHPNDTKSAADLLLYSDSTYSILNASSMKANNSLDWVLFRPAVSQHYYPSVNSTAVNSSAFISWERTFRRLDVDGATGGVIDRFNCLDAFYIALTNTSYYRINLDILDDCDLDLYLYHLKWGASTNSSGFLVKSARVGNGLDEHLTHLKPLYNDDYILIVARSNGSGSYTLELYQDLLFNDAAIEDYYDLSTAQEYFYETRPVYAFTYTAVWMQPIAPSNNFDLYLYSDSSYSNLVANSTRSTGLLEWVVFRSPSVQIYYPKVEAFSTGSAYIEWESQAFQLSPGWSATYTLSVSESIEVYYSLLFSESAYNLYLDVPVGGDFDLYLYALAEGAATSYAGHIAKSATVGDGVDELIFFNPPSDGYYGWLVVRANGSGSFTMYNNLFEPTPINTTKPRYDYFLSSINYFYKTQNLVSSNYSHVLWLNSISPSQDFDLSLYSNPGYSNYVGMSQRRSGTLEWIVFTPQTSNFFYPKVSAQPGSSGYAYFGLETSRFLQIQGQISGFLNSSTPIHIYDLSITSSCNIQLEVPAEADFDIYIFLKSGAGNLTHGFLLNSTKIGSGLDEQIEKLNPELSETYVLVLVRVNGSGTYILHTIYLRIPPSDFPVEMIVLIVVIGAVAAVIGYLFYKKMPKSAGSINLKDEARWINKALKYTPSFEEKLSDLIPKNQPLDKIEDAEINSFFRKPFTLFSSTILSRLKQMPLPDEDKIEILEALLILPQDQRDQYLENFLKYQQREQS